MQSGTHSHDIQRRALEEDLALRLQMTPVERVAKALEELFKHCCVRTTFFVGSDWTYVERPDVYRVMAERVLAASGGDEQLALSIILAIRG